MKQPMYFVVWGSGMYVQGVCEGSWPSPGPHNGHRFHAMNATYMALVTYLGEHISVVRDGSQCLRVAVRVACTLGSLG